MDSASWDERYAARELVWSATPNRWVGQVARLLPPGRALDLAGGEAGVGGPQAPAVLYTAQDAAADTTGLGLTVERCETVLREVATDEGPRSAVDALMLALSSPNETTAEPKGTPS